MPGCAPCQAAAAAAKKQWTVDIAGTGRYFADGTTSRSFVLISDANSAIAQLGLVGTIYPRQI